MTGGSTRRVKRLTAVSLVALGLVTGLGLATLEAPAAVFALLALGWVLMPAVLASSLRDPAAPLPARRAGIPGDARPARDLHRVAAGPAGGRRGLAADDGRHRCWAGPWACGSGIGSCPCPAPLTIPCPGDAGLLIAVHVGLVVVGWGLAATALLG